MWTSTEDLIDDVNGDDVVIAQVVSYIHNLIKLSAS